MKRIQQIIFYWLPVFIYCLLIFIQSSYPSLENIPDLPFLDKALHFTCFALLGVLFFRAFNTSFKENIRLVMVLSILSSGLYGLGDEIHQYYVPFREAEIMDGFADMLGGACGVFACVKCQNLFSKNCRIDKKAFFM